MRRTDAAATVGAALAARTGDPGHRLLAERLGRPAWTVRDWLRAFAAHVE